MPTAIYQLESLGKTGRFSEALSQKQKWSHVDWLEHAERSERSFLYHWKEICILWIFQEETQWIQSMQRNKFIFLIFLVSDTERYVSSEIQTWRAAFAQKTGLHNNTQQSAGYNILSWKRLKKYKLLIS